MLKKILLMVFGFIPVLANAWVYNTGAKVQELVQWEDGTGRNYTVIRLNDSQNTLCHVPHDEKELYTFVLALYMAGKTFHIHCHDDTSNIGGYESHKVHRINGI